jgi:hypothetical protein
MDQRRAYVLSVLPPVTLSNAPVATISGTPRSPTWRNTATLTIGGTDIVSYRFSLNGGAYAAETVVATPISLSGLANGTNIVRVIGRNSTGSWQEQSNATVRAWVVNTSWPAVRLNEVLARNVAAVNHSGTFPDVIELFNEGTASVDLSGLRLTDDPTDPNKFVFPNGTSLAAGAYLVVYANDPDATPGFHLGFSLDQNGEGVFLFHRVSGGGALLDSVAFGLQLADRSIGRLGTGGDWVLTQPTFGSANTAQTLGNPRNLRINEWLASGQNPLPDDFVELFNPEALPVALGGLYLTDQPIGAPARSPIAPLSFIEANGFTAFIADGDPNEGADHADFRLAVEQGEIGLFASDLSEIDCVVYGPQRTDVSSGRCPDGALTQRALVTPTPGAPNACPVAPPPPQMIALIPLANVWRYDNSGADIGTAWRNPGFDDSGWSSGPALLGVENAPLPSPGLNTVFSPYINTQVAYYFRTTFVLPGNLAASSLQMTLVLDDGALFFLNGVELPRVRMPSGDITLTTLPTATVGNATIEVFTLPVSALVSGTNVLAVQVHNNANPDSSDVVFGLALDAVIVTNSPAQAGVLINEVLANNATLEEPDGSAPDWVELYNPSSNAVDVAEMSLTDTTLTPRRWVFPTGSLVPALGFLKVRLDPNAPASITNTGFGLKANGGAVYLFHRPADGGGLASSVTYGLQAPDWTIGRVPDGSANWTLAIPSLGGANLAASLGDPSQLKINEWMAAPASGDDWFELFNPNAQPVNLSGLHLSDNLGNRTKYQIPALSFIASGPSGFQRFFAENGADADFTGFSLAAGGEALAVSTANGTLIHGLSFGAQTEGVSQGSLPDGAANVVSFTATPTPGRSNFLPLGNVVVNELLSHSDPPLEDAVELRNLSGDDVDISGWYLSDSQYNLRKYRIPSGTIVPAGGFKVFYEYQFNGDRPGEPFSFSSARGDEVYLSQATGGGQLTGYRAYAEFGPAENGVSFGRFPTSVGVDFTALSARTFGMDNPATTNEFRLGTGRTNAYAKVGPVVLNEIMYHPLDTNDALEFIELHNILGSPVQLFDPANPQNTWRLRKGIDFNFPPSTVIPAGGYLVIVSFDPLTEAASLAAFQAAYGNGMTLLGPYSGKLDNAGEAVELQKPDAPQTVPGPDFGLVPYVVADHVSYSDTAPWPTSPDGTGDSLRKMSSALYGNDPANWSGGPPTPGAANVASGGNTAPVLGAIGNKAVNEGSLLSFTATATDAEAPPQTLTFSLDPGAPAGASINPGTGQFTWAPEEDQGPGVYSVTVRVTDSGSPLMSDSEAISITVNEVNVAPVLAPIGNKVVNEGSPVTFTATATDADIPAQTLAYSLDPGAPAQATINPSTGAFTWTPGEADGPGVFNVTVRVTDNGSPPLDDSEAITVTVNEANSPPSINPIGERSVNEGALLSFTVTATDSDVPAQTLSFGLVGNVPAGAEINASSGLFTWTPAEDQAPATNSISVRVTDNGSPARSATNTFTAIANEVNSAPSINPIGDRTVDEGALLSFTVTATDPDVPAQTLSFGLVGTVPAGAQINSSSGLFTWTPGENQRGTTHTVRVRVTDNGSPARSATNTFTATVNESNAAPVLALISDKSVHSGELLSFTATATDSDLPPQTLTYSLAPGAPSGATIAGQSGAFSWTPNTSAGASTNPVTVRVLDNGSPPAQHQRSFQIEVVPLRILSISRAGGDVTLTLRVIPGRTYRVQYKDDLNAGTWNQLGSDRPATNNTLTVTDNISAAPQRFYRISAVPAP